MPRAQEPAEDECEGVVNDDALDLLGEALVTHLASPASCRRHRYSQHDAWRYSFQAVDRTTSFPARQSDSSRAEFRAARIWGQETSRNVSLINSFP